MARHIICRASHQVVVEDIQSYLVQDKRSGRAVSYNQVVLQNLPSKHALRKFDFSNTFNSVCQDIYPLHSSFHWRDKIIESAEAVQQGDRLGPLVVLFFWLPCTYIMYDQLCSPLCMMYSDDVPG